MKKKTVEEKLWAAGNNITPAAMLVDHMVRPPRVNIAPLLHSLEDKHALKIKYCWQGIVVTRDGDVVYEAGQYKPVKAVGRDQVVAQRVIVYSFLRWCLTHYPTQQLEEAKGWLYGQ
jgi:hypothetical protein